MLSYLENRLGKGGTSIPIKPQELWNKQPSGPPNASRWGDPPTKGTLVDYQKLWEQQTQARENHQAPSASTASASNHRGNANPH
jgi:hypothetical protein